MKSSARKVELASVDDLFSTEESRQDAALERVQIIPLTELHPFPDHPFSVKDDDDIMKETLDSVKARGILTPAIARPREGGGYELVAGHRRKRACELAGLDTMPVIVRNLDRDEAIIIMVDTNIQRENISPMEKAKALKMKLEAIKRQGQRTDLTCAQVEHKLDTKKSVEIVAAEAGESRAQVQRYIRLNELSPELQQMVDDKKIAMTPAVEISEKAGGGPHRADHRHPAEIFSQVLHSEKDGGNHHQSAGKLVEKAPAEPGEVTSQFYIGHPPGRTFLCPVFLCPGKEIFSLHAENLSF